MSRPLDAAAFGKLGRGDWVRERMTATLLRAEHDPASAMREPSDASASSALVSAKEAAAILSRMAGVKDVAPVDVREAAARGLLPVPVPGWPPVGDLYDPTHLAEAAGRASLVAEPAPLGRDAAHLAGGQRGPRRRRRSPRLRLRADGDHRVGGDRAERDVGQRCRANLSDRRSGSEVGHDPRDQSQGGIS